MAGQVVINFKAGGDDAILRALRTIGQVAADATRTRSREATRGAQAAVREEEKAAKEIAKAAQGAAAAQTKAAKDAARETAKSAQDAARAAVTAKKQEARELERIERDSHARQRQEQQAALRTEIAVARQRRATRSALFESSSRSLGKTAGTLAAVGGLAIGGLSLSTVFDAGKQQLDLGRRAALLQNASGITGTDFVGRAKGLSNLVGESAGDVLGGFEKIAGKAGGGALGGVLGNPEVLESLAKQAKAAGVTMTDLGDVVATLANRGVEVAEMPKTFASLVQQGKDGAVEIKDLATQLDASTGALLRFKMNAGAQTMTASGLSQIARTFGRSSAAEATSSVVDLARDLGSKADTVQALTGGKVTGYKMIGGKRHAVVGGGVEVGTDASRAQLRDVNDLLPEIIDRAFKSGNAGKLLGEGGVFTGNSTAIATPLIQAYNQGITKDASSGRYKLTTEGQAADVKGAEAIRALLTQFEAATADPAQGLKEFANVMSTSSEKISAAMNKLTNTLGDQLGAKIEQNLTTIVAGITKAGEGIAYVIDNPIKSALLLFGANLGKDLVGTLLGSFLKQKLGLVAMQAGVVNVSGGVGGGVPGVGGETGTLGKIGSTIKKVAPVAAAAAIPVAAVVTAIVGAYETAQAGNEDIDRSGDAARNRGNEATELAATIRAGRASPAEIARAKKLRGELKDDKGGARGALALYSEGSTAAYTQLAKGNFSAGNIFGALAGPIWGQARGLYDAAVGTGDANRRQGSNEESLKALSDALDKPLKLAEGQTVAIADPEALGAAIGAAAGKAMNADGPKVQH